MNAAMLQISSWKEKKITKNLLLSRNFKTNDKLMPIEIIRYFCSSVPVISLVTLTHHFRTGENVVSHFYSCTIIFSCYTQVMLSTKSKKIP